MVDYSNRNLRNLLYKIQDAYQRRAKSNSVLDFVRASTLINDTATLIEHPELFDSQAEYDQFVALNPIKDETLLIFGMGVMPFLNQRLYQMISPQINYEAQQLRGNTINSFNTEYRLQTVRDEVAQAQVKEIQEFIHASQQRIVNRIEPNISVKTITHDMKRDVDTLKRIMEQHEQQRTNALSYELELLKPDDERRTYKRWMWTPNPLTRHESMADMIVPLEEDFLVHSSQSTCPDEYMRYPLDPRGSRCQRLNCKCYLTYTNHK